MSQLRSEPADLAEALGHVVSDLPGLQVSLDAAPGLRLDEERTEALVRAVQEIVTNTARHAEARRLWIDVTGEAEDVVLTAVDDGRGSTAPADDGGPRDPRDWRGSRSGHGLRGIAERFEALGGHASFEAGDGHGGFRVTARVPAS